MAVDESKTQSICNASRGDLRRLRRGSGNEGDDARYLSEIDVARNATD